MSAGLLQEGHHLLRLTRTIVSNHSLIVHASNSLCQLVSSSFEKSRRQASSSSCLILGNIYDDLGGLQELVVLITLTVFLPLILLNASHSGE